MQSSEAEFRADTNLSTRGFARVASKIAVDPDKTTTLYRRFDELSARNLLLYQAKLSELEEQQKEYDNEDAYLQDEASIECQKDWSEWVRYAKDGVEQKEREKTKMELADEIRSTLEKYHAALAVHRSLLNVPPPSSNTIVAMRNWFFNNPSGSKHIAEHPQLWGASSTIYSSPEDLMALRVPADQDRLSQFITSNFSLFFQRRHLNPSSGPSRAIYISENSVSHFVAVFSTLLAAVLLFGAIISLYVVKSEQALLGMVSAWTVLFAMCVGLLTNARRDAIFAATAAYAAVLVVFVSGNLGNPQLVECRCSTPG